MTEIVSKASNTVTLIERAGALRPLLSELAGRHAAERRVSKEAIDALQEAGLFRVLQAKRWGGFEMDPAIFADIQIRLAQGDVAVAWVFGVIGVHAFQLALFDDRAARDVWSQDSSTLVASTYMPAGKATKVDGGFEFSGKWKFSSGCEHCDWILLGGMVGNPGDGDYRTFLVPRSEYEIVDTWHAMGLKGTGSQDISINSTFVPDYRVHAMADAYSGHSPGHEVNDGWVYKLSFPLVFGRSVTNACIGGLQGMVDAFVDYGAKRVGTTGAKTAFDPDAQLACAEAVSGIEEMTATMHRNYDQMFAYAKAGEQPPLALRLRYKYQGAAVADRCVEIAAKLFRCVGGTGIFEQYPFGRFYQDLLAARQHVSNQSQVSGRNFGATLLGLDNADSQI